MAFSPGAKDAQVSISVFGSLCSEMAAADQPEGVSSDNGDVSFLPGSVAGRPGLQEVFAHPFPGFTPPGGGPNVVPTLTYAKSFVTPTGVIYNLYYDSLLNLWYENLATPGTYTLLATMTGGAYAKSITAFGREYIAISDGLHGGDIPLQWDGTYLDRVTQDGPGTPPTVASISLPSVVMAVTGAPPVLTITESDPAGPAYPGGPFTRINSWTSSDVSTLTVGAAITLAGYGGSSAPMNGTWTVLSIYPGTPTSLLILQAYLPSTTVFSVAAATGTVGSGVTMTRQNNTVTVHTTAAHQLRVGYQAQISGIPAATIGGGVSSIVINNEDQPGLATVTTASAHGMVPGLYITINGVNGVGVGAAVTNAARAGGLVSVTTTNPHGLAPGSTITLSGAGNAALNGTATVASVQDPQNFTYVQPGSSADIAGVAGGTVSLNWPIQSSGAPQYFQVVSAPTATTFQIALFYSDGTWTSGAIQYAWNGTFFVTAVPDSTTLQYQQYGPNATTSVAGRVTPYGQAAPGLHRCQVLFLTRQGYTTRPSPPVQFTANGGQYVSVSNIPIGPPNVVARILAFTGANGAYFFYIPVVAQVNGQTVGTATQISDNTTTSALLDFSDNTLFAATAIGIPGNDLASQLVLDGALGFGFYASRLVTWGQRNRIQNLLNMGFDGGVSPATPTLPTGWTVFTPAGALVPGRFGIGQAYQIAARCDLEQSMFEDAYGAPIAQANTQYKLRAWIQSATPGAAVSYTISSASTGFSATATLTVTQPGAAGQWAEVDFSAKTPAAIPTDLILKINSSVFGGKTITVDEVSIIYADNPYLDTILYGSYVDNPEGFDGLSGKFGPSQDKHKIMEIGIVRQTLYLFTQDPGGRLHQTNDNGITEPAGWQVVQIAANCGLLSAFALTKSQADDSTASGGEEWLAWASASGARIFGGDQPFKISQEIQPDWDAITPAARLTIWALNDPVGRIMYFGLPVPRGAIATPGSPTLVYPVSYRGLDTAHQIATSAPIHTSYTGRLIATDSTRKWTRWNIAINAGALLYRAAGVLSVVFCGGNGQVPGAGTGTANAYTLNPAKLTDDDYGQINPYYTTYFMVSHDQEQQLQLGGGRKMLAYLAVFVSGVGTVNITPLCDTLANAWPVAMSRALSLTPAFDIEWGGGNAQAQRIALRISSAPLAGSTDNTFNIGKITVWLRKVAHLPVRGSAT